MPPSEPRRPSAKGEEPRESVDQESVSYAPTDIGADEAVSYAPTDPGSGDTASGVASRGESRPRSSLTSRSESRASATTVLTSLAGPGRVGIYELEEELGRGGMGVVYKAWHPIRRSHVALKTIIPAAADKESFQGLCDLFMREGAILMSIAHPNVVRCFDCNVAYQDGKPILYMALELLSGQSLAERLKGGPVPVRDAIVIAKSLAEALLALHENEEQILHRDVKPANVFITDDDEVKLLDFGLAAVADWRLTQVSLYAAGSRPYMSPEQFEGLRFCTERSDLYSLGVTLFETVTGSRPFRAENDQGYIDAHVHQSPPKLIECNPDLEDSEELRSVQNAVTKLLAKRPEERYQSAADLLADLHRVELGEGIRTYRVTSPEWERRKAMVKRAALLVATLVAVAFAATVGWDIYRRDFRVPNLLRSAESAVSALRLEDGREHVKAILELDEKHEGARQLQARIVELTGLRSDVDRLRERAVAEQSEGRLAAAVDIAEKALRQAIAGGAFSRTEVEILETWHEKLEQSRVEAMRREIDRARSSDPELSRAHPDPIASLADIVRGEEEARVLSVLRARIRHLNALTAVRADLEAGHYHAALAAIRVLEIEALESDLRGAAELMSGLAGAGDALVARDDPEAATRLVELSRAALSDAPPGENDWIVARLDDIGRAAEIQRRLRAVDAAAASAERRETSWSEVHALASAARRGLEAGAADSELIGEEHSHVRARLDELQEIARRSVFEDALLRARNLLIELRGADPDAAKARDAERWARKALHHLPPNEQERFRELARQYTETIRNDSDGVRESAERIRQDVRALRAAESAWLAFEEAHARSRVALGERLVPRVEGATLGEANSYRRNPPHVVSLPPFFVDATEARSDQFGTIESEGLEHASPPIGPSNSTRAGEGLPVRNVSFRDARRLAASVGKRLLTPDEWEIAASVRPSAPGGPHAVYPWGDVWLESVEGDPRPAGSTRADVSVHGLSDMGGNVCEWTAAVAPDGSVVPCAKGGSFRFSAALLPGYRALFRNTHRSYSTGDPLPFCGFRCARDVPAFDLEEFVR